MILHIHSNEIVSFFKSFAICYSTAFSIIIFDLPLLIELASAKLIFFVSGAIINETKNLTKRNKLKILI